MPNWVYNKVYFHGKEEKINELRDFVKGKEHVFDFNKIIPRPEELNLVSGSDETIARSCAVARAEGKTTSEEFEKPWSSGRTFEEWADLGDKYLSNIKKYGASTWYDWCWDNWGTKWNSSDAYWEDSKCVSFNTAWNAPTPIFKKLSELFPDVTFTVEYADEDVGSNCGIIKYDGKDFSEIEENTFEFACEVLGYDPDDFDRGDEYYE